LILEAREMRRLFIVLPAAMVPAVMLLLQRMHAPDIVAGMAVGALIGLSLSGFVRQRRRAASA
jgi:hypothetical protein